MTKRDLKFQSALDEEKLVELCNKLKVPTMHAQKIARLIVQHGYADFDEIPQIPKTLRAALNESFLPSTSTVVNRTDAKDKSTTKLLIRLQDGLMIESVIMRYGHVELDTFPEQEKQKRQTELQESGKPFRCNKRASLCVSSQVGCAMGCTFCATGTMGLIANLTPGEILEQVYHASRIEVLSPSLE